MPTPVSKKASMARLLSFELPPVTLVSLAPMASPTKRVPPFPIAIHSLNFKREVNK